MAGWGEAADRLAETGRDLYARGWAPGTSGNFSTVLNPEPLRLLISRSGLDKGRLTPQDFLEVDADGAVVSGSGRPSDETLVHLGIISRTGARAVLHTHSIWNTLTSLGHASAGGVAFEGLEMLKGLSGVKSHEHREWLPIVPNSQDYNWVAEAVEGAVARHPTAHGVLLRGHGLYTWGRDLDEARRHVEILEFLLELKGRLDGEGGARGHRQDP